MSKFNQFSFYLMLGFAIVNLAIFSFNDDLKNGIWALLFYIQSYIIYKEGNKCN